MHVSVFIPHRTAEEDIESSGARLTGSCEKLNVVLGTDFGSSARAVYS